MASGTINFYKSGLTSSGGYIIGKIEWSSVKNDSGNYSMVTAKLYCKKGHDSMTLTQATSGTWYYSLGIDGTTWEEKTSSGLDIFTGWVKIAEKTLRVNHGSDGKKSIRIEGSVIAPSGTSFQGKETYGYETVSLDTVPRASNITYVANVTLGNPCEIKWTPASSAFYYKTKFSLGNWNYTPGAIVPKITTEYTYMGYTIPYEVASYLPNAQTGTMTVTLYTYSDATFTDLIGSDTSTFKVTVPQIEVIVPSVVVDVSPVNEGLPSFFDGLFIQGKSKVKSDFTGTKANYSASLSSYRQYIDPVQKKVAHPTMTIVSEVLTKSGKYKVQHIAEDSRGIWGGKDIEIDVLPYSKPCIEPASGEREVVCERCDASGNLTPSGTYLKIKAKRSYSTLTSNGMKYNDCQLRYRYRVANGTWSAWVSLLEGSDSANEIDSQPISGVVSSITTTYEVQIGVVDVVGESVAVTCTVPTDEVNFHEREGGNGAAFGKYCEEAKALDVAPDWNVYGRLWGLGKCRSNVDEADLNDYIEFGVYAISSNMAAGELKNCPCENAGTLVVSSAIGDGLNSGPYIYILQKYIPLTGDLHYIRLVFTSGDGTYKFTRWQARGEIEWADLGLSNSVVPSEQNYGRYAKGTCAYKVVNENHIHLAFNCSFTYNGSPVQVNKAPLPQKYKPPRELFAMCATGGRAIARVVAKPDGNVYVDWVQSLTSASETTSSTIYWIDGYIDYWV
jgi:hypothetical protein